jgi:hypothetical protein
MPVSEAKLEANRRNAQKSTGPTSERGKERSSLNAVTHGCWAETLILRDEDPTELEARREAWTASLVPQSEAERRAVEDAVVYSWRQDRARRAEVALADARIADHKIGGDTTVKEEVIELGRRLFLDRLGPIEFYPTGIDDPEDIDRGPSTSFAGTGKQDSDEPAILVLRLQSTLEGCEWLLAEWAKLKKPLDRGQPWLSSDKLKAVRLLGKRPIDAIDDEDVALVFLASFALKPSRGKWYWEISMELIENDTERFERYAATRQLESLLKPADAAAAREALLRLIERVTKPLEVKAEAYRERASIKTSLAADLLAFDPSVEAERLRRHELASGRAMARSLDTLFKLRRNSGITNDDGGVRKSDVVRENAPNEPTDPQEIATNEPTELLENAPNEPTDGWENATNEPTDGWENAPNEPTVGWENASNEPTVGWENAPNEPTDGRENASNEPTDGWENSPNEPTAAAVREAETVREWTAGASDEHEDKVGLAESKEPGKTLQTAGEEPLEDALKRIRLRREEHTRQLNEQAQKEAAAARSARSARWPNLTYTESKLGHQPQRPAARSRPRRKKEPAAPETSSLEEFVKASLTLAALLESRQAVPD